jgi:hypothetical protein
LFDAVSRARLIPTPIGGTGAELNVLSQVEVADELRLNFDVWRRAMFTAPIARAPRVETRFATRTADPAAEVTAKALPIKGDTLLVVDVDVIAQQGDVDAALARFVASVRARNDWTLAAAQGQPSSQYERMLRDILVAGARAEVIPGATSDYDPARHGFPLELARSLAPAMVASRTLAGTTDAISLRPIDFSVLEPKIARGLLLRRLTGAFGGGANFPFTERLRASFTIALALLDRLTGERSDEIVTAAEVGLAAEIIANLERAIDTVQRSVNGDDAIAHLGEAKKAKTRVVRALPKLEEGVALPKRGELIAALRKACPAAIQSLGHLGDALKAPRAKASNAPQLRESVV